MNTTDTTDYEKWPANEPRASLAEIEYSVRVSLCLGDTSLGKHKDSCGRYTTGRSIQQIFGRMLITSLLRGLRGMSYPECADYLGLAHSTLITTLNNPLASSPFMIDAHNTVVRRILANRQLAKAKP